MRIFTVFVAFVVSIFILPGTLSASDYGTADEAKAMLENAIMALKKDNKQALADFTAGKAPFKMKDLYVFCFDMQSEKLIAHGASADLIGYDLNKMEDKAGTKFGSEFLKHAVEGEYNEVAYLWPRTPDAKEPSPKSSFIGRIGDIGCGVGYYK